MAKNWKICEHFEQCGGCSYQDVPYSEQIKSKREVLVSIVETEDVSIIFSPEIFGFRNKMEYSFEGENLGLHPAGHFDQVIDLSECPVFSDWLGPFFKKLKQFAKDNNIDFYARRNKNGKLRYVIVRESKFTGQKMLILVINGSDFSQKDKLVSMCRENIDGLASIVLAKRHLCGDSALTDDTELLFGKDYIEMEIGHVKIDISPYSFFQPNSYTVQSMYDVIKNKLEPDAEILDLFSGAGSIALYLADKAASVRGIENFEPCIKNAESNRDKNAIDNVDFVYSSVKSYIANMQEKYDYIVLDPPRGGMSYRIWKHLMRYQQEKSCLKRIFYISCSLKNLKTDLDYIRGNSNWKLRSVTGVDQFVHTPHLEVIVELEPAL